MREAVRSAAPALSLSARSRSSLNGVVGGRLACVAVCGCRGGADEATEPAAADPTATEPVGPVAPTEREIVLYFPGPNDELLHAERRSVLPIGAPEDRAKQCLEELARGPNPPLLAAIPDGAHLRQVYLLPDGTAFVDFSSEMLQHRGGSLGELQTIYAVVDTLTANVREIRRVGILVDGKARDTLAGHVDIAEPLSPDYRYVEARSRPARALNEARAPASRDDHNAAPAGEGGAPGAGAEDAEKGRAQEGRALPESRARRAAAVLQARLAAAAASDGDGTS